MELFSIRIQRTFQLVSTNDGKYDGTIRALYALLQPAVGEMADSYRLPDGDNGRPLRHGRQVRGQPQCSHLGVYNYAARRHAGCCGNYYSILQEMYQT